MISAKFDEDTRNVLVSNLFSRSKRDARTDTQLTDGRDLKMVSKQYRTCSLLSRTYDTIRIFRTYTTYYIVDYD